jgi:preprotein translocase subunit SecD
LNINYSMGNFMKTKWFLPILFFIFIIQSFGCKPGFIRRTGPHSVVVLELDTFGFYKIPGENNPANIRFLAKKASAVIEGRLIKLGINDDQFQLSDTNNLLTLKFWQKGEVKIPMERIRNLLQASGNLGFWEMYDAVQVVSDFSWKDDTIESNEHKTLITELEQSLKIDVNRINNARGNHDPLIGYAEPKDTEKIDKILSKVNLPKDMHFLWSFKTSKENNLVSLYAAKGNKPALSNEVIYEALAKKGNYGNYEIDFTMNDEGTKKWKELTKANVMKDIAITFDEKVVVCPRVMDEIPNGKCTVTGDFSADEANDLAAILSAGNMPVSIRIVQENIEN